MKSLLKYLLICLFLSACAQSEKDSTIPNVKNELEFNSVEVNQAEILSDTYIQWKKKTDAIVWKDIDPSGFALAQAYILAQQSQQELNTSRIDVIVWLLEQFKTIKDPAASSSEMLLLARSFIKKETN